LLGVTDKLLQNVIDEVQERDAIEEGQPKERYLRRLVKEMNELGISFSIWNKTNADSSEG